MKMEILPVFCENHPFAVISSYDVARHQADAHNVQCLPGTMFGPGQRRFLRVAFANLDARKINAFGRRLRAAAM